MVLLCSAQVHLWNRNRGYMDQPIWTTRRSLLTGATSLLFLNSMPATGAVAGADGKEPAAPASTPNDFRAAGGQVVAYFFGGWTQHGMARYPAPWHWINQGYADRLPTRSVSLPGHWFGWSFDASDREYTPVGAPNSALAVDAQLVRSGDKMLFTPTGPRASIRSPNFNGGKGADFPGIRFGVEAEKRALWQCAISFTTRSDPSVSGRVEVPEPTWDKMPAEIIVDMSGNEDWMTGNIQNVAIELGMPGRGTYILSGRFELVPSAALAQKLAATQGLPQDQQWAADWQLSTAASYGLDVFFMCTYWDGEGSFNKPVVDSMFASKAAPNLRVGLYFDSLAGLRPQSLAQFDELLEQWNGYFANTRYWRIDGRPVLGWHGGETTRDFLSAIPEFKSLHPNQRLTAMVRHMQDFYRGMANSNAKTGLYLVSGFMTDHPYWTGSNSKARGLWEEAGFDAGTVYNQFQSISKVPTTAKPSNGISGAQNFSELNQVYGDVADWITKRSGSRIRYFMPATAGWDARPWSVYNYRKNPNCAQNWGCMPNQAQFLLHLAGVRDRAMAYATASGQALSPVVTIDAWDEFGEGSFLCPTRGSGTKKLEAVRDIFGVRKR